PEIDRRNFVRVQVMFWLLCAIDGRAKNFSIFPESGGGYRLTPLYDVLSAYPVLGKASGKLSPKKVGMAVAVAGRRRHYRWSLIQRRNWEETARCCGVVAEFPATVAEIVGGQPSQVVAGVPQSPAGLPQDLDQAMRSRHHANMNRWRIIKNLIRCASRSPPHTATAIRNPS
ncbi:MAG: HipA domain-containing protein, partial [Steroidobacterales bacterium]